jgi:hypothetical protein
MLSVCMPAAKDVLYVPKGTYHQAMLRGPGRGTCRSTGLVQTALYTAQKQLAEAVLRIRSIWWLPCVVGW